MLRVGIVGFGFMGRMHFRCWKARDDAQVVAVCDANPNIKEDMLQAVGNIEGAAKGAKGQLIHVVTQYVYGDDQVVTAEGGWGVMPGFGFEMSFNLVMEKATIVCDLTREPALSVCPAEGEVFTPQVLQDDGYVRQIEHFARAVQGQPVPEVITLAQSRDSVKIVEAERQSVNTRKQVMVD